jgi:hypothetical protein
MDNNTPNKAKVDEHIWSHGKSASQFTSSRNDMSDERKEIIRQALKFNIVDIRSYTGYKGDMLVEITTMDHDVTLSLEKIAKTLGLEVVIQQDIISLYKIFCISLSNNTYDLK